MISNHRESGTKHASHARSRTAPLAEFAGLLLNVRHSEGNFRSIGTVSESSPGTSRRSGRSFLFFVALGVASVVLAGFFLLSLGVFNAPTTVESATTISSTSYDVAATSVIASVAAHPPDGYGQQSSIKPLQPNETGLVSGGYETFTAQDGSLANITVLVFDGPQSAQTYGTSVISNAKDLSGYTDVTGVLTSYQHYGVCYGYGEADPEGNGAIATGVCTKGNVYIQVHVVSASSLPSAEGDMADFVGAAYHGAG